MTMQHITDSNRSSKNNRKIPGLYNKKLYKKRNVAVQKYSVIGSVDFVLSFCFCFSFRLDLPSRTVSYVLVRIVTTNIP